ncbi:MAG: hypothetical protein H6Q72_482 [Firmicutes bacterium]|nr:hypothetical protein [Bacillota bacterium]
MICVKDHNNLLHISYDDIIKYHGRTFIAGAAMAYKLLELLSSILTDGILERDKFHIILGVNGPGIIDGIEMVTRAKSRGALTINQEIVRGKDAPLAADGAGGKYYFVVTYADKRLTVWLQHGLIRQEFLDLATKTHDGTITSIENKRLQQLKEELATLLISRDASDLFHFVQ